MIWRNGPSLWICGWNFKTISPIRQEFSYSLMETGLELHHTYKKANPWTTEKGSADYRGNVKGKLGNAVGNAAGGDWWVAQRRRVPTLDSHSWTAVATWKPISGSLGYILIILLPPRGRIHLLVYHIPLAIILLSQVTMVWVYIRITPVTWPAFIQGHGKVSTYWFIHSFMGKRFEWRYLEYRAAQACLWGKSFKSQEDNLDTLWKWFLDIPVTSTSLDPTTS